MENDQPEPVLPSFKDLRKRARFQTPAPSDFFTDSSEPAIFSSDDDPSVDNYANGRRRKKRLVGSWFQQSEQMLSSEAGPVPSALGTRRGLRRELDSGVWLASDDTVDANPKTEVQSVVHAPEEQARRVSSGFSRTASFRNVTPEEAKAQRIIEKCIDEGNENVDLSGLGLGGIASATVQPLSGFHLIPTVVEGVPFEGREPRMQLYLGNNNLTRMPAAVFDLSCLTVLSLRNNQLTELPPCIAQLRNLDHLNISFNRLRWLPRELLDLMVPRDNLEGFKLHPNPFCQPEVMKSGGREGWLGSVYSRPQKGFELQGPSSGVRENPWGNNGGECSVWTSCPVDGDWEEGSQLKRAGACYAARSPVQYINGTGLNTSSFDLDDGEWLPSENMFSEPAGPSPSSRLVAAEEESLTPPAPDAPAGPRSLLELSLQACRRAVAANADLRELMPENTPEPLLRVLALAEERGETDSYRCARPGCRGRSMVVPRTQWVEWWYLGEYTAHKEGPNASGTPGSRVLTFRAADRHPVPFVSRGCSWSCIPSAPEKRLPMGKEDHDTTFIVKPH